MAFEDILNKHHHCEVVIIPRFHKGKANLIPGLYCKDHACLIKWLTNRQSKQLQQSGVELLEPINTDKMSLMRQQLTYQDKLRSGNV